MVEHCREWATDTESLVWVNDQQRELSERGIVFLPKDIPHAYRITSKKADLLMTNTPAGIKVMFRATGRDKSTTRPTGFHVTPDPAVSANYVNVIVGPPR